MASRITLAWRWWLEQFWRPWVVEITVAQVVTASVILLVADRLYLRIGDAWYGAFFDEPAHITTALLVLNLLPRRWRDPILPWALPASFLIDADHLPQYVFHDYVLTHGTPRPYTHSVTSIVVVLIVALLWRRHWIAWVGIAVGLALHFLRDCAEDGHTGVSLLWPLTKHDDAYSQTLYLAIMAAVAAVGLIRAASLRSWAP